ncbi:MAG: hypothetical protein OEY52_15900 [Gammaproteobacteria bacterium]|nr:hypothetical protein [Gammaproteobacteria bacterium]
MGDTHIPVIIDIEASGSGEGSYPIEIGLVMEDGAAHCYLVQPYSDWTLWDKETEKLHRLTRETVERFGMDGAYVARQLNKLLEGKTIYSESWDLDHAWLNCLFERAGIAQKFELQHLSIITSEEQLMAWDTVRDQVIEESGLKRHRASADARITQTTWQQTQSDGRSAVNI